LEKENLCSKKDQAWRVWDTMHGAILLYRN